VRLQNFLRRHFVVVEEAIGCFHLRSTIGRSGNTEIRIGSEFFDNFAQPFVESLIAQIRAPNFILQSHGILTVQCGRHAQNLNTWF
jgi:hypothetical protein